MTGGATLLSMPALLSSAKEGGLPVRAITRGPKFGVTMGINHLSSICLVPMSSFNFLLATNWGRQHQYHCYHTCQ